MVCSVALTFAWLLSERPDRLWRTGREQRKAQRTGPRQSGVGFRWCVLVTVQMFRQRLAIRRDFGGVLDTYAPSPSVSSKRSVGEITRRRRRVLAARRPTSLHLERSSGSGSASSTSRAASESISAQGVPQATASGESLEVPGDVLAELLAAALLPMCSLSSSAWRRIMDLVPSPKRWGEGADLLARECRGQVAEQPRAAEAAATDDDAGHAGLLDHAERVGGLPDVAVAEDRDAHVAPPGGPSASRSRPHPSTPAPPCARAARSPRRWCPRRSGRHRGRRGGRRRGPCASSSSPGRYGVAAATAAVRTRRSRRFHGSVAAALRVTLAPAAEVQVDAPATAWCWRTRSRWPCRRSRGTVP